jgi:hypothetical protein
MKITGLNRNQMILISALLGDGITCATHDAFQMGEIYEQTKRALGLNDSEYAYQLTASWAASPISASPQIDPAEAPKKEKPLKATLTKRAQSGNLFVKLNRPLEGSDSLHYCIYCIYHAESGVSGIHATGSDLLITGGELLEYRIDRADHLHLLIMAGITEFKGFDKRAE